MQLNCEGRVEGRLSRGALSNLQPVSEVIADIFAEFPARDSGD